MKKVISCLLLLVALSITVSYRVGYEKGKDETIITLANALGSENIEESLPCLKVWRKVIDDSYETGYADGQELQEQLSRSWQYAAEHYGGICKWLLENKPIYGTVEMGDNATLSDCLFVSGGEYAVNIKGMNGLISNNRFTTCNIEWLVTLPAIDPNEFDAKVMLLTKGGKYQQGHYLGD